MMYFNGISPGSGPDKPDTGRQRVSKGKYARYFTTDIREESSIPGIIEGPTFGLRGARQMPGAGANFGWIVITKPLFIDKVPHVHDGDEYLFFLGAQVPDSFSTFDAEIDFSIGEEQEKYTITEPTLIFIPRGLLHTPLNFRKINKPVLFGMILLTPRFTKTERDGKQFSYDGPGVDGAPKTIDIEAM
jgi:hypothetical protein